MSDSELHIDYETRSIPKLEEVGLDNYMAHPSTQILMANYSRGERKISRWELHKQSTIPAELEDGLLDPFVLKIAWGASFERQVTKTLLGMDIPTEEWFCGMVCARYMGLPGKLHDAGEILGLKEEESKLRLGGGKTGKGAAMIRFFCEPTDGGGEETLFGISEPTFNDWSSHPAEWEQFCLYGEQDVVSERAAIRKMRKFLPPDSEWENWRLDQKINETGWPVDLDTVHGARWVALKALAPLHAELKELTHLANCNSVPQLLPWLQERGYGFDSLNKDFVARAMGGECEMTSEARRALELRIQTAKSSVSKYTALADMTAEDGRLRHQYTFYGAHTGREAAHGVNMGNLVKASKEVDKKLDRAVELVRLMDYDTIAREFSSPLEVAAGVQRSAFRAPEGKKFAVADLAAIENVGLGWLARCDAILSVFRDTFVYHGPDAVEYGTGKPITEGMTFPVDPYISFAVGMYKQSYHDLWCEWKIKGDSSKRTICKPPVLGGGYRLGPGKMEIDRETNMPYFTGLMGYGRKMGIELTEEQARISIQVLREKWKEVKWLWKDMEVAAAFAIRHPGQTIGVGVPQTDRDRDYFERLGRRVQEPLVHFKCHGTKVLEMILLSGRSMFYIDPRVQEEEKEWEGRKYRQDVIYHKGKDQKTKQWVEKDTHGGSLVENAVQAICRDILFYGLTLADKIGFEIVGSTYDEGITLVPVNGQLGVEDLCRCLTTPPPFFSGVPLSASGFEDQVYRKG